MITCLFYKRIIANCVDANTPLPGQARNHVRKCSTCRQTYASERDIAHRLLADASAQDCSPPPFLHAKIMSFVVGSAAHPEREANRVRFGWVLGLAMVCLLLAGVLWLRNPPAPGRSMGLRASRAVTASSVFPMVMELPDARRLRQWTETLDRPLETEMELVVNDAKMAINSLANSFISEKFRP